MLKYIRGGKWIDGVHFLTMRSGSHIELVLTLMVKGSGKGLEEHKDLRPKLLRLLVSKDIEVELKKLGY